MRHCRGFVYLLWNCLFHLHFYPETFIRIHSPPCCLLLGSSADGSDHSFKGTKGPEVALNPTAVPVAAG